MLPHIIAFMALGLTAIYFLSKEEKVEVYEEVKIDIEPWWGYDK